MSYRTKTKMIVLFAFIAALGFMGCQPEVTPITLVSSVAQPDPSSSFTINYDTINVSAITFKPVNSGNIVYRFNSAWSDGYCSLDQGWVVDGCHMSSTGDGAIVYMKITNSNGYLNTYSDGTTDYSPVTKYVSFGKNIPVAGTFAIEITNSDKQHYDDATYDYCIYLF